MIKLILLSFLCLALNGPVYGHSEEANPDCLTAGSVKIKLSINVPPGACGCDSTENGEEQNLCLGLENSQKISDAVLDVLKRNPESSYDVIKNLQLHRFIYGMEYNDFSKNIKDNDFSFDGYAELKELVGKYKICKKECKVYFTLRKALRENAANAKITEEKNADGDSKTITVEGDVIVLGDSIKEIQELLVRDIQVTNVVFKAKTFLADVNLPNALWHGKFVRVEAENMMITATSVWDVDGCTYRLF